MTTEETPFQKVIHLIERSFKQLQFNEYDRSILAKLEETLFRYAEGELRNSDLRPILHYLAFRTSAPHLQHQERCMLSHINQNLKMVYVE